MQSRAGFGCLASLSRSAHQIIPAQLERLCEHLLKLRLFKSRERLEALLQHAADKELAYSDFLEQVLSEEVADKTSKNVTMRTNMARFPFVKPLVRIPDQADRDFR